MPGCTGFAVGATSFGFGAVGGRVVMGLRGTRGGVQGWYPVIQR